MKRANPFALIGNAHGANLAAEDLIGHFKRLESAEGGAIARRQRREESPGSEGQDGR